MSENAFRFESLQIWQRAADLGSPLFKLAEKLDERRYYRFAEQLRAATLIRQRKVGSRRRQEPVDNCLEKMNLPGGSTWMSNRSKGWGGS